MSTPSRRASRSSIADERREHHADRRRVRCWRPLRAQRPPCAPPVGSFPLRSTRRQHETNVLGPVALAQLVLPGMRAAGRGPRADRQRQLHGGKITFPGGGVYHASKYALEALSDALRVEVAPFGVHVVLVQPGPVATAFDVNSADLSRYESGPYAGLARAMAKAVREQTPKGTPAEMVAATVVRAASARRPAARYRVGLMSKGLVLGRRVLPDRAWDAVMTRQFRDAPASPAA